LGVLYSSALADVHESYYGTNQKVVVTYWIGPTLNWKACSVGAPDDFVVHVGSLTAPKGKADAAFVAGVRHSIRASMMHYVVHALTDELDWVLVPQQLQRRGIAKRAITHHV
jgi:hypothetical protein